MRSLRPRFIALGCITAAASLALTPGLAVGQAVLGVTCHACGRNLIANPGADAAKGANGDSVVKVPDWQATGDFSCARRLFIRPCARMAPPAQKGGLMTTSATVLLAKVGLAAGPAL